MKFAIEYYTEFVRHQLRASGVGTVRQRDPHMRVCFAAIEQEHADALVGTLRHEATSVEAAEVETKDDVADDFVRVEAADSAASMDAIDWGISLEAAGAHPDASDAVISIDWDAPVPSPELPADPAMADAAIAVNIDWDLGATEASTQVDEPAHVSAAGSGALSGVPAPAASKGLMDSNHRHLFQTDLLEVSGVATCGPHRRFCLRRSRPSCSSESASWAPLAPLTRRLGATRR